MSAMLRSKSSEISQQRQSPRTPLYMKTTSSAESNSVHRPVRDRSPKVEDHRRSPRSPLPEVGVCNQKKRGTRVSDLETRLGHAKEELKKLKEQLASAENAKRDAQLELEETRKLISTTPPQQVEQEESGGGGEVEEVINPICSAKEQEEEEQVRDDPLAVNSKDSDVEAIVVVEAKEDIEESMEVDKIEVEEDGKVFFVEENFVETITVSDGNENNAADPTEKDNGEEISESKEIQMKTFLEENAALKKQLEEVKAEAVAAMAKEEELSLKVRSLTEELEKSKAKSSNLEEQLETVEAAKSQLEIEMKRLRIQTDQWRKAADAAADIISADGGIRMDTNCDSSGRRMSERCGSMDKYVGEGMGYEQSRNGYLGSPLMASELDDGMGNGKRKGAGIRMFGELWKKKGQQK